MKRRVDIDTMLADGQLELVLNGKTYTVRDIPLPTFLRAMESNEDENDLRVLHRQLASILDADEKEIEKVGLRAASLAVKTIRDWILEESEAEGEEGETTSENP